ncbi:TIGR01777 family oxidoreductase [Dyadobacter sandarakinus]|uniref:TIGR01777 family protein n=1 Tax=Dyadobacter sandarakinus TaxID=2747268 RepID=A0ABX7IAP3_9BACT|nr:TIGR01777 family oxidoreductase [Dyadobacter sandarakinus]QRR02517.1 TIGR01777 family protein [Dyadobacter sandarakinus]
MKKKVVVTGGSGLIGKRLTALLLEKGYEVAHLSRGTQPVTGVKVYQWDVARKYIDPAALEDVHYLVHLAGTNVAEGRWTEERMKYILHSRTDTLALLAETLDARGIRPAAFVSSSGTGYYGKDTGDTRLTEGDLPGADFLGQVCVAWEKAADAIRDMGVRTVKLRTGVVLSRDGGALPQIAAPARFGFGAPLGSGGQWISWIHIEDICRMYIDALENEHWEGPYNAVAGQPVTNAVLTRQICEVLHKPQWLPNVPGFLLKAALGEMSSVVLGSNYAVNHRVAGETSFQYSFPDLKAALKKELG